MEVKRANLLFVICIGVYIWLSSIYEILYAAAVQAGINVPEWLNYTISEFILLCLAVVFMAACRINPVRDLSYRVLRPVDALLSLIAGYCMLPMVLFLSSMSMLFSTNYLQETSSGLFSFSFPEQVLLIAIIPALVEELMFRGIFFSLYRKEGLLGAAIMSAVLFGCFHLNFNQALYAFAIGVIFAYMVEATGSIWSSVLAHFAINTYSITVIEVMKLTGVYSDYVELMQTASEAADMASESTVVQNGITELVATLIQLAFLATIAVAFMLLVFLCVRKMAKRNGRLENITGLSSCGENTAMQAKDGAAESTEWSGTESAGEKKSIRRFISLPLIIGVAICVVNMIIIEL